MRIKGIMGRSGKKKSKDDLDISVRAAVIDSSKGEMGLERSKEVRTARGAATDSSKGELEDLEQEKDKDDLDLSQMDLLGSKEVSTLRGAAAESDKGGCSRKGENRGSGL